MTDPAMSPAQKIRKALAERYCCEPDDIPTSMFEMESVACIVIRAAADQMPSDCPKVIQSLPEDAQRWYRLGFKAAGHKDRSWLSDMAAELEAQP